MAAILPSRARGQAAAAKPAGPERIDLSTLSVEGSKHKVPAWQDPQKNRLNNWTRKQGASAADKYKFKVVGVAPTVTRGRSSGTNKVTTHWKISNAEDRWAEDETIVYIAGAYLRSFEEHFPGKYSDNTGILRADPNAVVALGIAGPRDAVVETLIHHRVLPKLSRNASPEERAEYDAWVDDVAITLQNYQGNVNYNQLLAYDEQKEAEKKTAPVIDTKKLTDLLWLASLTSNSKKGALKILDKNYDQIGMYGGELTKAATNTFTDYIKKKLDAGADISALYIDISGLTTSADARVGSFTTKLTDEDIRLGNYGSNQKRPLNLQIDVHYGDQTYTIYAGSLWTSRADPINNLFKELDAVNKNSAEIGISYTIVGNRDQAKSATIDLLSHVKKKKVEGEGEEEPVKAAKLNPAALYSGK